MIDERFIYIAALLNGYGTLTYLIDTLKGRVKPNKVSWFMWALAPLIALAAQLSQGVGLQSLLTFMVGFGPLTIFIASFFSKKAEWKITQFDLICGGLSLIGLSLWVVTRVGNIAILFSIFADSLAAVPTLRKAYKAPETESYVPFFFAAISAAITLLTIKNWNFENYAFPIYIFLICVIFVLEIKFKAGKRLSKLARSFH